MAPDPTETRAQGELRARLRILLGKVGRVLAGDGTVDLLADHGDGDEVDALASAIQVLARRPQGEDAGQPSVARAASSTDPDDRGSDARGPTVLVVDDDPSVLQVTVELLAATGFSATQAASGEAALALVDGMAPDAFDALLVDLGMPRMTGQQFADRLGSRRGTSALIFMSGYLDAGEAALLEARHHAHILHKPFALKDLEALLRRALAGSP